MGALACARVPPIPKEKQETPRTAGTPPSTANPIAVGDSSVASPSCWAVSVMNSCWVQGIPGAALAGIHRGDFLSTFLGLGCSFGPFAACPLAQHHRSPLWGCGESCVPPLSGVFRGDDAPSESLLLWQRGGMEMLLPWQQPSAACGFTVLSCRSPNSLPSPLG